MTESLKNLYNNLILERQKSQVGFRKRENAGYVLEAYNPLCGDQFKLYLDFDGSHITQATYHGYGCALSKASTSLLIEGLTGKSPQACNEFIQTYYDSLNNSSIHQDDLIKALSMAKNFPGREQCILLSWQALSDFLNNNMLTIK